MKSIYREHRFYKKICACGCCNREYVPRKRGGNAITFGKNIRAVATYLSVVQCIPYERLQSLFKTMFNIRISQGTLAHLLRNLEYLNDIDKEQTWAKDIQAFLREAIHRGTRNPQR